MARFKARARTLDMLGRQQIAGIPTALHELFKNSHDAYAECVEVDFFRASNILLLRDDGMGMTRADFENKWLTLGTESKLSSGSSTSDLVKPKGKKERAVMGEKGIGRLAIATIGPQVLVLTRDYNHNIPGKITISLINWGMFELPGIDLNEIEIPVDEYQSVDEVSEDRISRLIEIILHNISEIAPRTDSFLISRIRNELQNFPISQAIKTLSLPYGPSLRNEGHGTHFFITPVNETLISDIDENVSSNGATNLQRMLLGFSNTMQGTDSVPITTEFRDHLKDGSTIQRAGWEEFFTPDEYEVADHHIQGVFDEYGNFKGEVSVYQNEPRESEIILNSSGEKLECGSFKINFAYIQGDRRDTLIPFETYGALKRKLDRIGGLYIYKNGIRVLPYGNSDYDFLEIERRRTLHAGHYFFSYRRMFGAIHLDKENNSALQEKAGREGFQSNKAYRQFRNNLMKFFEQLAAHYFREDGVYSEEWSSKKDSLQSQHDILERRKKAVSYQKKVWQSDLDKFFEKIELNDPKAKFEQICIETEKKLSTLVNSFNLEDVAEDIINLEVSANKQLKETFDGYMVKKPRGVGFTKKLEKEWRAYEKCLTDIVTPSFSQAQTNLNLLVGSVAQQAKVHLDVRARLHASISSIRDYSFRKVKDEQNTTQSALEITDRYVNDQIKFSKIALREAQTSVEKEIGEVDFSSLDNDSVEKLRVKLENQLEGVSRDLREKLETIKSQLKRVSVDGEEASIASDDSVSALETELEVLRTDYNESLEMAQLGMAVSVIHHEFESNIKSVRQALQALQKWANKNQVLKKLYDDMRNGFDHLDNYLSLFTPLDRRLRRRKTKITGEAIADFLKDLFEERMKRHRVTLNVTSKFMEQSFKTYASVVYPVFVNVVDNAFYWLSQKDGIREITLDATKVGFLIKDNGPGISPRDQPYLFDFGYSRKLGGRGMGLYIAKTSLNKEGLDIKVVNMECGGACFAIETMDEKE